MIVRLRGALWLVAAVGALMSLSGCAPSPVVREPETTPVTAVPGAGAPRAAWLAPGRLVLAYPQAGGDVFLEATWPVAAGSGWRGPSSGWLGMRLGITDRLRQKRVRRRAPPAQEYTAYGCSCYGLTRFTVPPCEGRTSTDAVIHKTARHLCTPKPRRRQRGCGGRRSDSKLATTWEPPYR